MIASLYVACLSLSTNNTSSPYVLGAARSLPHLHGSVANSADALAPLAGAGTSGAIGSVRTISGADCYPRMFSGATLLCLVCSGFLTSSSCTVLLPKPFSINSFSRNTLFLATNTLPSVLR
jgi:hypothetical protein